MKIESDIDDRRKHLLVVLGMHRGGTSLASRATSTLSFQHGARLMAAAPDNEKGFWEDADLTRLNDTLLERIGASWDSLSPSIGDQAAGDDALRLRSSAQDLLIRKFASADWLAFKDPRTARLLAFWQTVFADLDLNVRYLLVVRNPLSVAASLEKRNGFAAEKSIYLWLQHIIPMVTGTRGCCRSVLDFDRLIASPGSEVRRVASELGLADRLDLDELKRFSTDFLDQRLRHTEFVSADLPFHPAVPNLAADVLEVLGRVVSGEWAMDSDEVSSAFGRFGKALDDLRPALHFMAMVDSDARDLRSALAQREGQLAQCEAQIARLDQALAQKVSELRRVYSSNSWVLTRPLRSAGSLLRVIFRKHYDHFG